MDEPVTSERKSILVAGHFSGVGALRKLHYIERLYDALEKVGCHLVIVNMSTSAADTKYEYISCPIDIAIPYRISGSDFLTRDDLPPELYRAAVVDAEMNQQSFPESAFRILLYTSWIREIIVEKDISLCLIWHKFNGPHHALTALCENMGIPHLYMEYGLLPGTVAFDADGQMGESRVTVRYKQFNGLSVRSRDLDSACRLLELACTTRRTHKSQDSTLDVKGLSQSLRKKVRAVVFYAGQNDWASGMLPQPFKEARIHSPIYEDTLDALSHLSEIAELNNWHILFKPHPMVEDRHCHYKVPFPERITLVLGANIFECIESADVCVTILSQAAYLFLIHNRPCVMLGRHQIYRKGCVYEPETRAEVSDAIQKALSEGITDSQERCFERHIARLCRYYLYAVDEDVEAIIEKGPDYAARSLVHYMTSEKRTDGFPFANDLIAKPLNGSLQDLRNTSTGAQKKGCHSKRYALFLNDKYQHIRNLIAKTWLGKWLHNFLKN